MCQGKFSICEKILKEEEIIKIKNCPLILVKTYISNIANVFSEKIGCWLVFEKIEVEIEITKSLNFLLLIFFSILLFSQWSTICCRDGKALALLKLLIPMGGVNLLYASALLTTSLSYSVM